MNKSVREFTFSGTVSITKRVAITTYSDNYEIAYEKALECLENAVDIDEYIIDSDEEYAVDIDEYESKLLHEI